MPSSTSVHIYYIAYIYWSETDREKESERQKEGEKERARASRGREINGYVLWIHSQGIPNNIKYIRIAKVITQKRETPALRQKKSNRNASGLL